jgi:CBS domain-containing protein
MSDPIFAILPGSFEPDQAPFPVAVATVNRIIPDGQELLVVAPHTNVIDALELMRAHDYSQLPVIEGGRVLGSFSNRSFARAMLEARKLKQRVDELDVVDCVETLRFADVDDDLADLFDDFDRKEAVFVGDRRRLLAIATATDVLRFLYQITSPFVMLREIEMAVRRILALGAGPDIVASVIAKAVHHEYEGRRNEIPTRVDELTFAQYYLVICRGENYPLFAPILGASRTWTQTRLKPLIELRNDVMHFRRELTPDDHGVLLSVREWLFTRLRAVDSAVSSHD